MTTLVVAAHPDDEVLGCGATMARLAREGERVVIAILGEGATSRDGTEGSSAHVRTLADQSRKVAALVGASDVHLFGLPDNRFDTVPLLEIAKIVERVVEDERPDVVFTQHGGDLNIDHALTFRAVMTATRPGCGADVDTVYAFEVGSSTEWSFQRFAPVFHPTVFFDVTDTLAIKLGAMAEYKDEARPFPHPRSPEALRAAAARWGTVAGVQAAEAFELIRTVRR